MASSSARLGQVQGPKVIAYYADADGQYSANKIGFDVELFDESVRKIAFGSIRKDQDGTDSSDVNEDDEDMAIGMDFGNHSDTQEEKPETITIRKEFVKFICDNMEVDARLANKVLRHTKGSLEDALLHLIHEKDFK